MVEKIPPPNKSLLEKFEKDLESQKKLFFKHIKNKHKGFPVETCHTCGYFAQAITNDKDVIRDLSENK